MHVDWNQSSIDSDRVTRENGQAGDYVQWDPMELFYLHDWNVIFVRDGADFQRIAAAQRRALAIDNGQPTAIVYRTTKGWKYGIEGRASHGAGHKLCTPSFFDALPLPKTLVDALPHCDTDSLCSSGRNAAMVERCWLESLNALSRWIEGEKTMTRVLGERIVNAKNRLDEKHRQPRASAPQVNDAYALAASSTVPPELELKPGTETTLRGQLGKSIGYLNRYSGGAFFIAAADLLGSTSIAEAAKEFAPGFHHVTKNPDSRTLSVGGICEDAISGVEAAALYNDRQTVIDDAVSKRLKLKAGANVVRAAIIKAGGATILRGIVGLGSRGFARSTGSTGPEGKKASRITGRSSRNSRSAV